MEQNNRTKTRELNKQIIFDKNGRFTQGTLISVRCKRYVGPRASFIINNEPITRCRDHEHQVLAQSSSSSF